MNRIVVTACLAVVPRKFTADTALKALLLCFLTLSAIASATADSAVPPIFRSNSSQFIFLKPVNPAPDITTLTLDGTPTNLSHLRGKVVVLNFWATWCLPCTYEMPLLERLAASVDPDRLTVVAVSIDRDGAAVVAPFIEGHNLNHLVVQLDPDQHLGSLSQDHLAAGALPLWGLPISYIIDKRGRVVGYITGAAKWDSPQARSFLDYFMNSN